MGLPVYGTHKKKRILIHFVRNTGHIHLCVYVSLVFPTSAHTHTHKNPSFARTLLLVFVCSLLTWEKQLYFFISS